MSKSETQTGQLCVGFLFVLTILVGCNSFQKPERDLVYVTASALNLRENPTTQARVVVRLERGQELEVIEKKEAWMHVKVDETQNGWVHSDYVGNPESVRSALQKDLSRKSHSRKVRPIQPVASPPPSETAPTQPKPIVDSDHMNINAMLIGMPADLVLEEMDALEGQPRVMGAGSGGQVVVEFWGPEQDVQRAEVMVSVVDVSDDKLNQNAQVVLQFIHNAVPHWKRDVDWVADFLKNLSSKDEGKGGFDTKEKKVRFLFIKPLGSIRVTIENAL